MDADGGWWWQELMWNSHRDTMRKYIIPLSCFYIPWSRYVWVVGFFFFLLSFLSGWGIKTISATLEKEKGQFRPAGDNTEEKSGGGKSEHQGIWQGTKYLSPLQNRGRATFSLKFCIYFPRKNSYRILCSSSPDKVFTGQNYCQINFCLYLWYHYCNLFVPQ